MQNRHRHRQAGAWCLGGLLLAGCWQAKARLVVGEHHQGPSGFMTCLLPTEAVGHPPLKIHVWPTCDTTDDIRLEVYLVGTLASLAEPKRELAGLPAHQRADLERWLTEWPSPGSTLRVEFRAKCRRDTNTSAFGYTRARGECHVP